MWASKRPRGGTSGKAARLAPAQPRSGQAASRLRFRIARVRVGSGMKSTHRAIATASCHHKPSIHGGLDDSNDSDDVLKSEELAAKPHPPANPLANDENIVTSVTTGHLDQTNGNAQASPASHMNPVGTMAPAFCADSNDRPSGTTAPVKQLTAKKLRKLAKLQRLIECWWASQPDPAPPYYFGSDLAAWIGKSMTALAPALRSLGWSSTQCRIHGVQRAIWIPPKSSFQQRPIGRPSTLPSQN